MLTCALLALDGLTLLPHRFQVDVIPVNALDDDPTDGCGLGSVRFADVDHIADDDLSPLGALGSRKPLRHFQSPLR